MSELLEPEDDQPIKTPRKAGAPLPRLWKYDGDDSSEAGESEIKKKKREKAEAAKAAKAGVPAPAVKPAKKARKKDDAGSKPKKTKSKVGDADSKGVLVEKTPELDTYETRRRIRLAIGVGFVGVMALVGFVVYKTFAPVSDESGELGGGNDGVATSATTGNSREKVEQEARILFNRAAEVAKGGKPEMAITLLEKITTSYATTLAAAEAQQALNRPSQNLPLFLDTPTVVATPGDPKTIASSKSSEIKVVDATKPAVPKQPGTEAGLVLPVNPPEPSRNPGETTPAPTTPAVVTKPLPDSFHPRSGTAVHPSGWPIEIVGDRDGAPMVLVFGDTFIQGRDDADPAEGPSHKVTLGRYYIDVHEVTVRQFNLFQKETAKRTERARAIAKDAALANASEDEDRPVVMVSARDAGDFASWAGKRLPTEAQWEAAARTPDGRIHPWGPEPAAWTKPRAPRQIDPVRSYPLDVSPYGVSDLAGNAWEWTKDWYDPKYYQQFKTGAANNPTGPPTRPKAAQLVVKGTSKEWLASKRDGLRFDTRLPYLGFRCVLPVEGGGGGADAPGPATGKPAGGQGGNDVPF